MDPLNKNIWFRGGVKVAFCPFFNNSFRVVASHLDDNLTVLSKTDKKKLISLRTKRNQSGCGSSVFGARVRVRVRWVGEASLNGATVPPNGCCENCERSQ